MFSKESFLIFHKKETLKKLSIFQEFSELKKIKEPTLKMFLII